MADLLNPADPAFARDPYPYYARLRARGPAARVELANGTHAWLVTGYREARAVLSDPRFSNVPPKAAGRPGPTRPPAAPRRASPVTCSTPTPPTTPGSAG
ncbi:hypothetical protein ACQEVS_01620 [Streptomyces sp. CA-181903]|uniref:hypothetical protein n=1 Tax=Streptomyces sp. CA-181903 TaxID=3240055 RepID=UPI003D8E8D42